MSTSTAPTNRDLPNKYLVVLKRDADMENHLNWLQQRSKDGSSKCEVIVKFDSIKGYGAKLSGPVLDEIARHPDVMMSMLVGDSVVDD
ncbi:hypothetical protein RSOLAG22IIIB_12353 [Rhizoctonia solani]|uniref:Inhibitor I9 domain-containing protein n=1 Tax=Rhizoctonia solani TaxID=456999 RepID=A0A0K6GD65_9AGAM|nr:unnamed protein product [Rhizoctonia solani]CUA76538.1 hypothetical protein RSOLAG22IIIB_12353 [Rhizoctonia solani]